MILPGRAPAPRIGQRIPGWWIRARAIRARLCRFLTGRTLITALITGSNGKTTTTNMLSRIMSEAGHTVGRATTDGIFIQNDEVWTGDFADYKGAGWVVTEPRVTAAVLETNRLGLLIRGLYLKQVDAAALINIGLEHIGDRGVDSQEKMALLKKRVTDAARKAVVLNADDRLCRSIGTSYPIERTILYSCEADNSFVLDFLVRGGRALCLEQTEFGECMVYRHGTRREEIMKVSEIPSALGGSLRFNLANGMAAAGLALGMGLSITDVSRGLGRFRLDSVENPGRFTLLDDYVARVLVNQGANPISLKATLPGIADIPVPGRRFCLVTSPDNRAEEHIAMMTNELAGHFDRYLVFLVDRLVSVREPGWAVDTMVRGLTDATDADESTVTRHTSLDDAVRAVFSECGEDDLVVVLGISMRNARETLEKEAPRKIA